MTELPERIWACMGGPMVGLFVSGGNNGGWPEYVSADIVQSLTAERDARIDPAHVQAMIDAAEPALAEALAAVEADRDRLLKMLEAVIDEYNGHMYGPTMHAVEAARSELDTADGT